MHHRAEYGVANHWGYKLGERNKHIITKAPSAQYLLPSTKETSASPALVNKSSVSVVTEATTKNSYLNSFHSLRHEMASEQLYVFVAVISSAYISGRNGEYRTGMLVSLTVGSNVKDAILALLKEQSFTVKTDLFTSLGSDTNGFHPTSVGIVLNGSKASWNDPVETGDILIVTMYCNGI